METIIEHPAIRCGFYPSLNHDRTYRADDFARLFREYFTDGVSLKTRTNSLQVIAGENMEIIIRSGFINILGYWMDVPSDIVVRLPNADGTYPRIDRIVVRHRGGRGVKDSRSMEFWILSGLPAANPVPLPLCRDGTDFDMCLAEIRAEPGDLEITQAQITDTRPNKDLCGFAGNAAGVDIDTTELFSQFSAAFYELMEQIHDTLGQDAATNLLNLINAQTQQLTDYEGKTDTKIAALESSSASHTSTLSSHSTIISRLNKKRVEKILTINSGFIGNKEVIYTPLKPFSEFAMLILYVGGSATNYYENQGTPSYTEITTVTVNEAVPLTYLVDRLDSKDQSLLVYGKYELYNRYGDGKTIKSDGFLNFYAGSSNATISINNIKVFDKPYSCYSGNINAKITVYGVR